MRGAAQQMTNVQRRRRSGTAGASQRVAVSLTPREEDGEQDERVWLFHNNFNEQRTTDLYCIYIYIFFMFIFSSKEKKKS